MKPKKQAAAAVAIWIASSLACNAQQIIGGDLRTVDQAASGLASQIIEAVREDIVPGVPYRIVVFRFATDRGEERFGPEYSVDTPRTLQGSIIHELITRSSGKYLCDSEDQIVDRLGTTKKNLNISQTRDAKAFMEQHEIDAVVVGQIHHRVPFEDEWDNQGNHTIRTVHSKVRGTVFLRSAGSSAEPRIKVRQVADRVIPGEEQYLRTQIDRSGRSGKYTVTVECDGDVLPYDQSGRLLVQQKYYGKPFSIRLKHTGNSGKWLNHNRSASRMRLTKAVVYVDGVSVLLRNGVRFTGSPNDATGRVLAPPNHSVVIRQDKRFRARRWQPGEHKYWEVELNGFEKNTELFERFTFANDEDSIGRDEGVDDEIGVISVFFFEEKLGGDIHVNDYIAEQTNRLTKLRERLGGGQYPTGPGTTAGEPFRGQVTRGKIDVHRQPAEVWRIKYDYVPDLVDDRSLDSGNFITDAQRHRVQLKVGEVAYFHQPWMRSSDQETIASINEEISEVTLQLQQRGSLSRRWRRR